MLRQVVAVIVVATVAGLVGVACGGGGSGSSSQLRAGRDTYGDVCSTCHGNRGQGGIAPALDQVLSTWPRCDEQMLWITLGSEGWKDEFGPTYGADDTEITGVMPGQGENLTAREIAEVAAFERVEYGGGDVDEVLDDCGLVGS